MIRQKLITLDQVRERLNAIFPAEFPDRGILVGIMAARTVFVALYGSFITGNERYFRPSTVTNFSPEQAALDTDEQREAWATSCHKSKFEHLGKAWYKDNTREPIRDDLLRNRLIPLGIASKLEGYAPTASTPIYSLAPDFTALFDADLVDAPLEAAITAWRAKHLDPMTLKRMALLATGIKKKKGDVEITLPETGKVLRLTAGDASLITKDVCEVFSVAMLKRPVVVHVSLSDRKLFPELQEAAAALGLKFDPKADLPDVAIADVGHDKLRLVFIEVVHSDGPVSELRARALLKIAADAGIPPEHVMLVTAFEDRTAPAFKKRVSELAVGSMVWFRAEPWVLMHLHALSKPGD